MAAADLDGDGTIEIVVTTTNTATTGAQVFVFEPDGTLYQPAGASFTAWPRYNTATGPGNDADFNGQGNHGYGCYGENVGIGNLDDDPQLEIVVTYDNHQINVFKHDGTSVLASQLVHEPGDDVPGQAHGLGAVHPLGRPDGRGQPLPPAHRPWPDVNTTMWLQWTASPPNVVDVDGDGKNEVVGIPNAEEHDALRDAGLRVHGARRRVRRRLALGAAARRRSRRCPMSDQPAVRATGDYYPPDGIPAPTTVEHRRRRAPRDRRADQRRLRLRHRPRRHAPLAVRLREGRAEDVRVRGRRRRSQRRRHRPSSSSARTRCSRTAGTSSSSRTPARCSSTSRCPTRA